MKLAMTSIAVTASICASASEAALLVASFMQFSLADDPPKGERFGDKITRLLNESARARCWARVVDARDGLMTRFDSYSEYPATSIRFDESPLSEYRRCQSRIVMRRHFGSRVTTLAKFPPTKSNQKLSRVRQRG